MRKWLVMLGVFGLSAALHTGVASANINDLADAYAGDASSTNNASLEDAGFSFEVKSRQSNGSFTGNALGNPGIPISGKVSSNGKFSFSGQGSGSSGMTTFDLKLKGKGQLSAAGKFIGGTLNLKGQLNGSSINFNYIFFIEEEGIMEMGAARRRTILDF